MPIRPSTATVTGTRVYLRPPAATDAAAFVAAARASRRHHGPWTSPPDTRARFALYVGRYAGDPATAKDVGFLVFRREDDALVGVFNFSEIVRGVFRSTYLGYYGFAPHAGQGYMTEGMALALDVAFRRLGLHRVEVNIQPTNERSLALARRVGFRREGYSPRYVKIAGRWRDHVRFAILAEEWRERRGRVLRPRARRA
ncbi:MAG: GNAT family protein [Burkholderiales bacterium]